MNAVTGLILAQLEFVGFSHLREVAARILVEK
jgi:hypothetical protein